MSIVKYVKDELPKDGALVYCDNPPYSSDRAIYKGGIFTGGGEFPVASYEMKNVTKWFDYELYSKLMEEKPENEYGYGVSFELAVKL